MQTTAAIGVGVCLLLLVFDFSRRWGKPRSYIGSERRVTYAVAALIVVALVIVNVVDR